MATGGAVAVLGVAIAALALLFTGHAGPDRRTWSARPRVSLGPRHSVPLAVHLAVRHDHPHHVAIGLAHHEFAHSELVPEFLGNPVRFRDPDPDRVLDHPVTGVAEIKNRLLPRPLTTQLGGQSLGQGGERNS